MATGEDLSVALLEADIVNARVKVLRAARGVVRHEGARHSVMSLKHALKVFDAAMYKAYQARRPAIDPLCPTSECVGECKPESHGG